MSEGKSAESVEAFIHKVEWLHEIEYGDFKRKLSLYIRRLEEDLSGQNLLVQKIIAEIRDRVIYNPASDIEGSRLLTLNLAERIRERLN